MCKTDDVLSVCKDNLAELFLSVLLNYPIIILSEKEIVDSEIKKINKQQLISGQNKRVRITMPTVW